MQNIRTEIKKLFMDLVEFSSDINDLNLMAKDAWKIIPEQLGMDEICATISHHANIKLSSILFAEHGPLEKELRTCGASDTEVSLILKHCQQMGDAIKIASNIHDNAIHCLELFRKFQKNYEIFAKDNEWFCDNG